MSYPLGGSYQRLQARPSHFAASRSHEDQPSEVGHSDLENESQVASGGEWKPIPYRKLARWLGLIIASFGTIVAVYGSIIGWRAYLVAALPHKVHGATEAEINAGELIVQPYFGPKSKGALVENANLLATIWYREGVSPESRGPDPEFAKTNKEWEWYRPTHGDVHGFGTNEEYGPMSRDYEQNKTTWEQILAFSTHLNSVRDTKQVTHDVLLPGRIVHSLATNPWSRLVATFALKPSNASEVSATSRDFDYVTAKAQELYGDTAVWPPSQHFTTSAISLHDFLAGSGVGYDLASAYYDPPRWNDLTLMRPEIEPNESVFTTALIGRTWLTHADDYPTYTLKGYNTAIENVREEKHRCRNITRSMWWPGLAPCDRTFQREGHFENMLKAHQEATQADRQIIARYGPFLTTRLTSAAAKEYIRLPKAHTLQNVTAWDVAALSPLKLQLARKAIDSARNDYRRDGWGFDRFNPMLSPHVTAMNTDRAELLNSLMGHEYSPGSRPVLRAFLKAMGVGFRYFAIFLLGLYWYTRQVSSGLAIEVLLVETILTLIVYITQAAINWVGTNVFWLSLTCAGLLLVAVKQVFLRHRFQIQLSGLIPTEFRVRGHREDEWSSYKQRKQLGWKVPAATATAAFIILRAGLLPPPIISARDFEDHELMHWRDDPDTWLAYRPWIGVLSLYRTMNALGSSASLVARIEQIRLNHAQRSFAGAYVIGTYFSLLAMVCSSIPAIFVKWLGRSEYMAPFGAWDVLILILHGVIVWQARWLPKIAQ